MAVGDIYQANNEFTYQGNPNVYSWFLRVDVEAVPDNVPDDVLVFADQRVTAWLPLHNPSVEFRCNTVRQVYPTFSLPELQVYDPTQSGNRTCTPLTAHLPGQCSCVVTLYGDKADPTGYNRGRDFITGACCDDQIDGEFNDGPGSYLEDLCALYATMTNQFANGGNTFTIGIYSRSRAKPENWPAVPSVVPFFFPLEFVRGRQLVRTQRRRQPLDPCEVVCDRDVTDSPPI